MHKRVATILFLLFAILTLAWGTGCIGNNLSTLNVAGERRAYLLHVPPDLNPTKRYPLVLALHQFSDTPEGTETLSGFSDLADKEGFFVAYPKGKFRTWNPGMRSGPDDVKFIEALVDDLARVHPIDTTRVYACGLSAGGMMSQWLACKSDRFAAVAALAGSLTQAAVDTLAPGRAVPVMLLHGKEDPVVPYGGGETNAGPGMKPTFLSAEAGAAFWAKRNGCGDAPTQEILPPMAPADPGQVLKFTFPCSAPTELLRYEIIGGGHTWPGHKNWYPAFIVGPTSHQIDATAEIWRFFQRHTKS